MGGEEENEKQKEQIRRGRKGEGERQDTGEGSEQEEAAEGEAEEGEEGKGIGSERVGEVLDKGLQSKAGTVDNDVSTQLYKHTGCCLVKIFQQRTQSA
jgi:hypothetical protein